MHDTEMSGSTPRSRNRPSRISISAVRWTLGLALAAAVLLMLLMRPVGADVVFIEDGEVLGLELHRGQIVRLQRPAASVFVADPDIADVQIKSARLFYLLGRGVGETTLFVVGPNDEVVASRRVQVRHNLEALRSALTALAPESGIQVDSVDRNLVLSGTVDSAATAENLRRVAARFVEDEEALINRLRVAGPRQINLRVRVAEMSRNLERRLGVRWSEFGLFPGVGPGFPGTGLVSPGRGFGGGFEGGRLTGMAGSFIGGVGIARGQFNLNFLIDALSEEGLITILAEPNLTTMSGETASFLAGGEFPIPVAQRENTITLEFKEFGVGLTFTPTLLDGERISLRVSPEVSELSPGDGIALLGITVPGITTRRATTTVELGSGQSFAIAGLLRNTTSQDVARLPGLGDLPIIGALFRSTAFLSGETELVIIVTPYLVEPISSPRVVATPIDGYVPPNDVERILLGRFVGSDAPSGMTMESGALAGIVNRPRPIGFLLE